MRYMHEIKMNSAYFVTKYSSVHFIYHEMDTKMRSGDATSTIALLRAEGERVLHWMHSFVGVGKARAEVQV